MRIGIPRALMYYCYFPMWNTFFKELGHQVILSPMTTKAVVDKGVISCVDDACFPVKVFHGHVLELIGKVDAIFLPRLVSVYPGEFICPKFIGLPEMIKSSIKDHPRLFTLDLNSHKRMDGGYKAYMELGTKIGAKPDAIKSALRLACSRQRGFEMALELGQHPLEIINPLKYKSVGQNKGVIGLIGHPYLLYDNYASMNLIDKLAANGYDIIVPENIPSKDIEDVCARLPKKLFWSYGKKLLGSSLVMLERKMVDGAIFLTSFGCGIDSFMGELIQRFNQREYRVPIATISVDEHSGHAGFNTRLEAFLDMIRWRDEYGGHLSSYGESLCSHQSII